MLGCRWQVIGQVNIRVYRGRYCSVLQFGYCVESLVFEESGTKEEKSLEVLQI